MSASTVPSGNDAINASSSSGLARSEVLYFIQNKCKVLPFDKIVSICSDFYSLSETEAACSILVDLLSNMKQTGKHTGAEDVKRKKTVKDMVSCALIRRYSYQTSILWICRG